MMPPDGTILLGSLVDRSGLITFQRLAAVGRGEHHLAAVVHRVVIEGIGGERRRPVTAVLHEVRRRIERVHPRADRSRDLRARLPAGHLVAVAARPDHVRIRNVGHREARLAAAEAGLPRGRADARAAPAPPAEAAPAAAAAGILRTPGADARDARIRRHVRHGHRRIARPTHRPVVLPVAVDPVRHLVVGRDVVHLADRQLDLIEGLAVIDRDAHAAVARGNPVVGVLPVHPDVVAVAAAAAVVDREVLAAVERPVKAAVGDEDFVWRSPG